MSCNLSYDNIIFAVYKKSRFKNDTYNVFVGIVNPKIKNVLNKLEKRENIVKEDVKLLKDNYPKDYMDWVNVVKNKIKIRFIDCKIQIDDTLNDIRKKIFVYLSDFDNKDFILPENQQLWMQRESNSADEIIGYYYENTETKTKENISPSINITLNKDTIANETDAFDISYLKKNTSENNLVVYDLIEELHLKKNIIFLCDALDEEKYFKSLKINISEKIINNYFKKYWPYVNLNVDKNEVKNTYLLVQDFYNKENYIFNLIDNITIDNVQFGSCNVFTSVIEVNSSKSNDYVDLFQIFDYLKDNQIGEKVPFIKYSEESFELPFSIISQKAINSKKIDKKMVVDWLGLNNIEDYRRMNGLMVKRYFKTFNDKPRYYSIFFSKNGMVTLNISFLSDNNATFHDIEYIINDCNSFIKDINKNRIVKKVGESAKIEPPELEFKNRQLILKDNTKIIFLNIIIPLNLNKPIDFKKLHEFSNKFPYFLVNVSKELNKKKHGDNVSEYMARSTDNSFEIIYKRISRFANMNDILFEIDKLKEKHIDNNIIVKILQKKYQKSIDEIKHYLIEWERKYSSSKSSKGNTEFKKGLSIIVTDKNISIRGITKIYQIPLIYKFFTAFLTMFINYEDYVKEDKVFKKIFLQNLGNNVTSFENRYEFNDKVKLNLNQLNNANYNYNYDYDYEGDDYENYGNKLIKEANGSSNGTVSQSLNEIVSKNPAIRGLSSDDEIGTDVRLTCDDPIPEKDTCEDFCNDEKYFLRRLQRYDNPLFKPSTDKKNKYESYARKCQSLSQPVVLAQDPEKNPKIKRESFSYAIKYSSDPDLRQRWYICPKIWCAYCEIPILESDIDPKTIRIRATKNYGNTCKTAICPYGNHQVFIREKDNQFYIHPGFLKKAEHPLGLCLPSCFKLPQNNPKSSSYKSFKKCLGDVVENTNIKEGQIYILGKGIPIEQGRYGKLTVEIERLLKSRLDTGYLGEKSGFLRKGIKQEKNNSFLSAICDIFSCDKVGFKIDVKKMKNFLVEKLNDNLFKSLHSGNLVNLFKNIENFKKYLLTDNEVITHEYLWDFMQRPNILFEDGINVFLFENNHLVCPKGENVNYFFDKTKKSVLIIKMKDYYEPIYYLEGSIDKKVKIVCFFDSSHKAIDKILNIYKNGCNDSINNANNIDWCALLKDNMQLYDIHLDNINIQNLYDLQLTLNELLINIKNNKLNNGFIPKIQYVDSYNKVFALLLENGLYLPVSPSKLMTELKYKVIMDLNEVNKISVKDTIKYTEQIVQNTNLKIDITHKVLDLKEKKNIVALVNRNNRFIPIIPTPDNEKRLKVSVLNYYSDIDEALYDKLEYPDDRMEIMNKKKFEDETYMRLKFELSKFIHMKENKDYYEKIMEIINANTKDIAKCRSKMFVLLNSIFINLISYSKKDIDYDDYVTPNKRIPCYLRSKKDKKSKNGNKNSGSGNGNSNSNKVILSCEDDPHCTYVNNKCKLFVNKINLIDKRKLNNYDYYISKIVDELLRYKLKRNEILNDNIPIIINKENVQSNPSKYVVIHSLNYNEINNIVNFLFRDKDEVIIDHRNLYESSTTKDMDIKKDKYIKANISKINDTKFEDLSIYWLKILGDKYKVKINEGESLIQMITIIINLPEFKTDRNNEVLTVENIKNKLLEIFMQAKNKDSILNVYRNKSKDLKKEKKEKKEKNKKNKKKGKNDKKGNNKKNIEIVENTNVTKNINELTDKILNSDYEGSEGDLVFLSKIFNFNVVIIDKRIKKNEIGFRLIKSKNYKSDLFIILYKSVIVDKNIYSFVQLKSKVLFKINEFPKKFIDLIDLNNKEGNEIK